MPKLNLAYIAIFLLTEEHEIVIHGVCGMLSVVWQKSYINVNKEFLANHYLHATLIFLFLAHVPHSFPNYRWRFKAISLIVNLIAQRFVVLVGWVIRSINSLSIIKFLKNCWINFPWRSAVVLYFWHMITSLADALHLTHRSAFTQCRNGGYQKISFFEYHNQWLGCILYIITILPICLDCFYKDLDTSMLSWGFHIIFLHIYLPNNSEYYLELGNCMTYVFNIWVKCRFQGAKSFQEASLKTFRIN